MKSKLLLGAALSVSLFAVSACSSSSDDRPAASGEKYWAPLTQGLGDYEPWPKLEDLVQRGADVVARGRVVKMTDGPPLGGAKDDPNAINTILLHIPVDDVIRSDAPLARKTVLVRIEKPPLVSGEDTLRLTFPSPAGIFVLQRVDKIRTPQGAVIRQGSPVQSRYGPVFALATPEGLFTEDGDQLVTPLARERRGQLWASVQARSLDALAGEIAKGG